MTKRNGFSRITHALAEASAWPGRIASWAVLLIMIFTLLSVFFAQLRIGTLVSWETRLPLIGRHITLAGLTEFQWHFFGVMVMLGGAYAFRENSHIRVDILYANFSQRTRRVVDLLGDVILLIPFCIIITQLSLGYVERSFLTGEGSDYGGLQDRFLIKAMIPAGLMLLAFAAAIRVLGNLHILFFGGQPEPGEDPFEDGPGQSLPDEAVGGVQDAQDPAVRSHTKAT